MSGLPPRPAFPVARETKMAAPRRRFGRGRHRHGCPPGSPFPPSSSTPPLCVPLRLCDPREAGPSGSLARLAGGWFAPAAFPARLSAAARSPPAAAPASPASSLSLSLQGPPASCQRSGALLGLALRASPGRPGRGWHQGPASSRASFSVREPGLLSLQGPLASCQRSGALLGLAVRVSPGRPGRGWHQGPASSRASFSVREPGLPSLSARPACLLPEVRSPPGARPASLSRAPREGLAPGAGLVPSLFLRQGARPPLSLSLCKARLLLARGQEPSWGSPCELPPGAPGGVGTRGRPRPEPLSPSGSPASPLSLSLQGPLASCQRSGALLGLALRASPGRPGRGWQQGPASSRASFSVREPGLLSLQGPLASCQRSGALLGLALRASPGRPGRGWHQGPASSRASFSVREPGLPSLCKARLPLARGQEPSWGSPCEPLPGAPGGVGTRGRPRPEPLSPSGSPASSLCKARLPLARGQEPSWGLPCEPLPGAPGGVGTRVRPPPEPLSPSLLRPAAPVSPPPRLPFASASLPPAAGGRVLACPPGVGDSPPRGRCFPGRGRGGAGRRSQSPPEAALTDGRPAPPPERAPVPSPGRAVTHLDGAGWLGKTTRRARRLLGGRPKPRSARRPAGLRGGPAMSSPRDSVQVPDDRDFGVFRTECLAEDGWTLTYNKSGLVVWVQMLEAERSLHKIK
ncbi:collagen alpha-1(I) chain-like, partial [Heteronotia binoei]|uniref:collagen alpha-1(I) chain-like n=1 Tax=Heteronotia binoei TaxID=13085 RepID=UPI00292D4A80